MTKTIKYKKRKGLLFIISSPSGGGKTTIGNIILHDFPNLHRSISTTTRPPRPGEIDGKDYHFISQKEFEREIIKEHFLEWAKVHGNYYGTSKDNLKLLKNGQNDLLLTIDVQGAENIRRNLANSVSIFILPPSLKVLAERLKKRDCDSPAEIKKRMKIARQELSHLPTYNYVIINEDLPKAVLELKSIIIAERCRLSNHHGI